MMHEHDPPILDDLMSWCFNRVPGREARRHRVRILFKEFSDLVSDRIPIITVAGTSGKGTTCALIESVLAASGHITGVFTKPHLLSFRERISVAAQPVSNAELEEHTDLIFFRLRAFVKRHGPALHPSLFEALLLIAASIFRRNGVTIAVYEAAVGGSNDATSLLPSCLSVVTSVDIDHQNELGHSIEEIAKDKAGIAAPGGVLVLGAGLSGTVRSVMASENARRGVRCVQAIGDAIKVVSRTMDGQTIRCSYKNTAYSVFLPFPGSHQALNFATVWTLTQIMHELHYIESVEAIRGVKRTRLAGRFEFIRGSPSWLLDVAHNTASIEALIDTASQFFSKERIVAVLGATEPHAYQYFVQLICKWGIRVGLCEGFPKAVSVHKLAKEVPHQHQILGQFDSPAEAVDHFMTATEFDDTIVMVTGSLFLVGRWRHELSKRCLLPETED